MDFVRKVEEYGADVVFILDIPNVSKEFFDNVKAKVVWIDHHPLLYDRSVYEDNVLYLNPKLFDHKEHSSTSYWSYKIARQDVWLGVIGSLSDWDLPDFFDEFAEKYSRLVPKKYNNVADYRFKGELGLLIKLFVFNVKGKTSEAMKSLKILTRIDDPYEILDRSTPRAKFLYRKYEKFNQVYPTLVSSVKVSDDPFIVFTYTDKTTSFTPELSNHFIYKYPDKVVIVGRVRKGEIKCSIRSAKYEVRDIVLKLVEEFKESGATGGGHEHTCGATIKVNDFDRFVQRFREEIKKLAS
jgi:nanoRNase/pAp phosphatase (c-di-AMP/oligoRNAs hydrolase)